MKTVLPLVLCLLSQSILGQQKDYLIKHSGDTLWGKIKLKHGVFSVSNEQTIELNAGEVWKVKSSYYKGSVVVPCKLILYSDNIDDYQIDYFKREAVDTVMIVDEIYSTPKINLYYAVNDFKVPFYFYKTPSDSLPVQLVIRYYLDGGMANRERDPGKYHGEKVKIGIVEDKGYVNQLYAIMGDCKKISPGMWELLSYREYSFKDLIRRYNKCK